MQKLLYFGRSMRYESPEFILGKDCLNSVFKQDYDHEIISTLQWPHIVVQSRIIPAIFRRLLQSSTPD